MKISAELLRDPGYRAALHILTSRTFRRNDARLWKHVHVDRGDFGSEINFDRILVEPWSSTERLMLRAAWSLFNNDHDVNLWELVHRLSDEQARTVLDAIACAMFHTYIPKAGLLHESETPRSGRPRP